jgi:hypothetical protein
MSPPSWYQIAQGTTPEKLIAKQDRLKKKQSFLENHKGNLFLALEQEHFKLRHVLANLRTISCCFDCQLRLVDQREESERTIQALQMRLDLLDVKLYTIQEKITFLDCYIPRLIEMEHDMFLYELSLLDHACR